MRSLTEALKLWGLVLFIIFAMGIAGKSDYEEAVRLEEIKNESPAFRLSQFR
jgi:hypothetical protein